MFRFKGTCSALLFGVALLASAGWAAGEPEQQKSDPGRKLVLDICTTCHEIDLITGQQLSREQWSTVIKGMISEGAVVTDEEFNLIVDYLAKNFGKKNSGEKK